MGVISRSARAGLSFVPSLDYISPRVRWPDGRGVLRKQGVEESPGSTETRCRITTGGGDPRYSATEMTPLTRASGSKGEMVR